MKKVLMILTKNRRDCVDINLRLHERGGSFKVFDHVVFLLNGVTRRHLRFIDAFCERHPSLATDKIIGDGSRPKGISDMQNCCVAKYPGAFYAKTDEDVFVPNGWAQRMIEAYEEHQNCDDLALITPLIPNNAYGLYVLLSRFYPDLLEEHQRAFACDPSPEPQGLTWQSPAVGAWATRSFIHLEKANERQRQRLKECNSPAYRRFSSYFSIGCIGYDYRHWTKMGGIPWNDEPGWCDWISTHHQTNILDCRQIILHYTFFVQQEWLDRTSLLEEVRQANLPESVSWADQCRVHQACRWIRQTPGILKRRFPRLNLE